jgi:TPR repeat protein
MRATALSDKADYGNVAKNAVVVMVAKGKAMQRTILILVGLLLASASAFAGDLEDAKAAYERGDYATAVSKLTTAAKQGNSHAQFNLGVMYFYGDGVSRDQDKGVYWFMKAAEQGYAVAQHNLGYMYFSGEGVPKNHKKALYWRTQAAEQGYANAQNSLGTMYEKGDGVSRDYKQAVYWYTRAAEQGDEIAQNNLGAMYHHGTGVTRNPIEAYKWFMLAVALGDKNARKNLAMAERQMTPEQIAEGKRLASEWKPR